MSQGPPYSLPGISQTLQQPQGPSQEQANIDRERELRERETRERETREREMIESHAAQHAAQQEEHAKREAEQRDRDLHERQQREQATHQNHSAPMQIHQPVAVAPSTRTIHGPNGLLGQSGPLAGANSLAGPMGGPNAAGPLYGNAPAQHDQTTPRMQHAVQAPTQAQMLMPFTGPPGAMGMGQGQQPILNVSGTGICLFDLHTNFT
jgi:paired amphipathic helix protein Sin3a